jgi:ribonuclease HII
MGPSPIGGSNLSAVGTRGQLMPDFIFEDTLGGVVAGIDEVGRGPLAGPVLAAAVILDRSRIPPRLLAKLNDSKLLSPKLRVELRELLTDCALIGLGRAEIADIDRINILNATLLAMTRAYEALTQKADWALVDGNRPPKLPCPVQTIVKGDRKSLSIAAASVVAKVARDEEMTRLAQAYPGYGWERNAGYGTAQHLEALHRLGATPHHRRSFAPVRAITNP